MLSKYYMDICSQPTTYICANSIKYYASKKSRNPYCELVVWFVSKLHQPLNPMARVNCHLSGLVFKYGDVTMHGE